MTENTPNNPEELDSEELDSEEFESSEYDSDDEAYQAKLAAILPTPADLELLDKLLEVDSSMISAMKYITASKTLEVWFDSGARWAYFEVPFGEFKGLLEASSKGSYMRNYIIGEYDEERLSKKGRRR
jgi:hypothetical protein